jgi:hypothetical protein
MKTRYVADDSQLQETKVKCRCVKCRATFAAVLKLESRDGASTECPWCLHVMAGTVKRSVEMVFEPVMNIMK